MIPRYGHQMCFVFLWETWLEKQAETSKGYLNYLSSELGMSRSMTGIDLDRGSGNRSFTCTVIPKNFFCCCCVGRSTFNEFPFFFFFSFSCIVALHKHWRILDHLTVSSAGLLRRLSLGGKISVAEVMHLLTINVFSANFRVVLVVVAFFLFFFSFIFSLTFFFPSFSSGDFELFFFFLSRNNLGVHLDWDVFCSTIDIVVAIKASGHCAMGKRAGVFGAHSVQGHRRWGRPRQGLLGALENKNLSQT